MSDNGLIKLLEWDSAFFGKKIATVCDQKLCTKSIAAAVNKSLEERIDCLYLLVSAEDSSAVRDIEENGFHMVDIRVTLSRGITPDKSKWTPLSADIRLAKSEDIPALSLIAAAGHTDSRFYSDPGFPRELCDRLYATWIEKSCNGYAQAVLVAEHDGEAAGYTSCHINPDGSGQIGLVGVGENFQGKGLGKSLISESLRWFASQGCSKVLVVTQGKNVGAQRLYQKNGFLTDSVQLWYHRWAVSEQ
ncbi:MAG: GNAT family N-acetyltransferase [Geobacteraceae bacterium]|nr:GNAT family N-acetyltransferase [Geobacteraceae bacterium]